MCSGVSTCAVVSRASSRGLCTARLTRCSGWLAGCRAVKRARGVRRSLARRRFGAPDRLDALLLLGGQRVVVEQLELGPAPLLVDHAQPHAMLEPVDQQPRPTVAPLPAI